MRPYLGVAPLALAIALGAHLERFGGEHAFGGRFSEVLLAVLAAGVLAATAAGLWAVLEAATRSSGGTRTGGRTGSLAGLALGLAAGGTLMYVGGELLEGLRAETLAAPLLMILVLSLLVAGAVRALTAWLRAIAIALFESASRLSPSPVLVVRSAQHTCAPSVLRAYSRYSRPPPALS